MNIRQIKNNSIELNVLHYTHSIPQQAIMSKQILSKLPTDLQYTKRSVFMEEVNTQKIWTFEMGTQEGINNVDSYVDYCRFPAKG